MKNRRNIRVWGCSLFLILGLLLTASIHAVQEKSDEALKKKYAAILGEYEFEDGALLLNYYIDAGELWVDSGDGRPAIMQPVEGKLFVFKAEDPQTGIFDISFEKDEQGEYTVNRVSNETAGLEVVGYKIK